MAPFHLLKTIYSNQSSLKCTHKRIDLVSKRTTPYPAYSIWYPTRRHHSRDFKNSTNSKRKIQLSIWIRFWAEPIRISSNISRRDWKTFNEWTRMLQTTTHQLKRLLLVTHSAHIVSIQALEALVIQTIGHRNWTVWECEQIYRQATTTIWITRWLTKIWIWIKFNRKFKCLERM